MPSFKEYTDRSSDSILRGARDDNVVGGVNGDRTSGARYEQIGALAGDAPQRR